MVARSTEEERTIVCGSGATPSMSPSVPAVGTLLEGFGSGTQHLQQQQAENQDSSPSARVTLTSSCIHRRRDWFHRLVSVLRILLTERATVCSPCAIPGTVWPIQHATVSTDLRGDSLEENDSNQQKLAYCAIL